MGELLSPVVKIVNMHKEIGSEFWTGCTPIANNKDYSMRPRAIYDNHPYQIVETLSGRTALEHVVEILVNKGKRTAYLPAFCCHTMIEPFLTHGMDVSFYDVVLTEKGLHRLVDEDHHLDCILLLDYFGHTDTETFEIALREKSKGITTIYDATHSMYSEVNYYPYDFIYGSYRKWTDINCGFLAWKEPLEGGSIIQNSSEGNAYPIMREKLFNIKASYMEGGGISKDKFLPLVDAAESILEEQYHHKMPDARSRDVLRHTDVGFLKKVRKQNARFLTESINDMEDCRIRCFNTTINEQSTPLFVAVSVAVEDRDNLRKHLIDNQIYCPIHWPISKLYPHNTKTKVLFDSELSLVCDQRYGLDDMQRMTDSIVAYFK